MESYDVSIGRSCLYMRKPHSANRIPRSANRIRRSARRSAGKKLMLCIARRAPIARAGLDRTKLT